VTRNYNVTLCFYFTINAVRHGKFLCLPFSFTSREEPVSLGQVLLWKKAFFARATGIRSLGFLYGAKLNRANLRYATLFRANLSEADLSEADLRETDLRGAVLRRTNLHTTNFQGANLEGADLSGIPWLLVMEMTLQPGVKLKAIRWEVEHEEKTTGRPGAS